MGEVEFEFGIRLVFRILVFNYVILLCIEFDNFIFKYNWYNICFYFYYSNYGILFILCFYYGDFIK